MNSFNKKIRKIFLAGFATISTSAAMVACDKNTVQNINYNEFTNLISKINPINFFSHNALANSEMFESADPLAKISVVGLSKINPGKVNVYDVKENGKEKKAHILSDFSKNDNEIVSDSNNNIIFKWKVDNPELRSLQQLVFSYNFDYTFTANNVIGEKKSVVIDNLTTFFALKYVNNKLEVVSDHKYSNCKSEDYSPEHFHTNFQTNEFNWEKIDLGLGANVFKVGELPDEPNWNKPYDHEDLLVGTISDNIYSFSFNEKVLHVHSSRKFMKFDINGEDNNASLHLYGWVDTIDDKFNFGLKNVSVAQFINI